MCLLDHSRPTGTRIVAIIQLISGVLTLIGLIFNPIDRDIETWIVFTAYGFIIVILVMSLCLLISTCVPRSKHHIRFLRVWLVWSGLCAICMLLSMLAMVVVLLPGNHRLESVAGAITLKSGLSLFLQCSFILIVNSHYETLRQMKDEPEKPNESPKKIESDV